MPRLAKNVVAARETLAVKMFQEGACLDTVQAALKAGWHGQAMNLPRLTELQRLHSNTHSASKTASVSVPATVTVPVIATLTPTKEVVTTLVSVKNDATVKTPFPTLNSVRQHIPIPASEVIIEGKLSDIIEFLEGTVI
jgi:hypothetical protein